MQRLPQTGEMNGNLVAWIGVVWLILLATVLISTMKKQKQK